MSSPGAPSRRQKRMGPAPFASFEDLSDELDSPEDKNASGSVVRLPGIREDVTPCSPTSQDQSKLEFVYTGISLIGAPSTPTVGGSAPPVVPMQLAQPPVGPAKMSLTPTAPRIDISRASSSSHHDSKDSSPEREEGANVKLGLGFREEGTLELRSSTEELDFQEQQKQAKPRPHSPVPHDDSYHSHNRKDSQSSEVGLLCISGRTSRLSSIGSQGSAHSRVSNASHLSVISGQSGVSRSPSPHKMLLETSFCGTKPQKQSQSIEKEEGTKDDLEKVLLKRKHDPTQALIAEGITVETPKPPPPARPMRKSEIEAAAAAAAAAAASAAAAAAAAATTPKKTEITIKIDKPTNDILKPKLPKHIVSESGIEYIYIPLKGPMPEETKSSSAPKNGAITKSKVRETKSASTLSKAPPPKDLKQKSKSASPSPLVTRSHPDEPKYIRIKLKPDHMYDDSQATELQKPDSLDLHDSPRKPPQTFEQIMSYRTESPQFTPSASPKPKRHLKEPPANSKSPSPSLSRKSSFASIFKSRETISPESPTSSHRRKNTLGAIINAGERRRSRSKSRDRTSLGPSSTESIDSKGKQKSVFSLFKSKKNSQRDLDTASPELPNLEGLVNVEFKFNNETTKKKSKYHENKLDGDSIRIPLHSPTYYDQKNLLQDFKTSSQDSQETVIEVAPKSESNKTQNTKEYTNRQSSTSSENLVFSTRLGSNNELFTTKLPKEKYKNDEVTTAIVETKTPIKEEPKQPTPPPTPPRIQTPPHPKPQYHSKPQSPQTQYHSKPQSPQTQYHSKPQSPQTQYHSKPQSPQTQFHSKPQSPQTQFQPKPQSPQTQYYPKPQSPQTQYYPKPQSPQTPSQSKQQPQYHFDQQPKTQSPCKPERVRPKPQPDFEVEFDSQLQPEPPSTPKEEICVAKTRILEKPEKPTVISIEPKQATPTKHEMKTFKIERKEVIEKTEAPLPHHKSSHEDDRYSSESERDSEADRKDFPIEAEAVEPERKGLVLQQDSFEDELPYIPTTLPQERSVAVPIVPIKQRHTFEMKTCPIERPRSTTPINPTCLEEYCEEVVGSINVDTITKTIEKLKISLPRDDEKPKAKSPRRTGSGNWFDFSKIKPAEPPPPPLPPKGLQKEWINFEEIPERRKPPKRIQTIPSRSNIDVPETVLQENVIYTYVNPEDCKCECHDRAVQPPAEEPAVREDELPLLEDDTVEDDKIAPVERMKLDVTILDRRSIVSDSSVDLSTTVDHSDANGIDHSLRTPFTSDLGISSNRSSIISQDDAKSPDTDSPNAFPKAT